MEAIVWPYPCGISLLAVSEGETVRSVLDGENTRSVMAASDGRLAIYESAAMVLRGPTLVISPLIAVPRDQAATITAQPGGGAALIHAAVRQMKRREPWLPWRRGSWNVCSSQPSRSTSWKYVSGCGRPSAGERANAILFSCPEDLGIHRCFDRGGRVNAEQVGQGGEAIQQADQPLGRQE